MKQVNDVFPRWPILDEEERREILEVVNSGKWWRMFGSKVKQFERLFSKLHQTSHALAVTNGTHAIELALLALGVREGDEVIVPAFTFISTAQPVMRLGAVPVPVDVDAKTFCIDPSKIREAVTDRTVGIIPVHMGGHMCDMDRLTEIAEEFGLFIIEDACHAHGAEWKGKRAGSFGDASVFSFQQLKLMTAGEGGALLTNSKELYEKAFLYHNVGRPIGDKTYQHLVEGSNYRISEFQAAILIPQAKRLEAQNQLRERNARRLDEALTAIEGIVPQGRREECTIHSHYMYMFYYDAAKFGGISREKFVELLNKEGIPAYVAYTQIHETQMFKKFLKGLGGYQFPNQLHCPVSKKISQEVVWIHHRVLLGDEDTALIIADAIRRIQQRNKTLI